MTNRHVLEPLLATRDKKVGVGRGAAAFLFVTGEPEGENVAVAGMMATDITQIYLPSAKDAKEVPKRLPKYRGLNVSEVLLPTPPDIGACKIDPNDCHPAALPLQPVHIEDSSVINVGMPVGILGFPQGLDFPIRFDSEVDIQLTPLLQTGVVSGILPFAGVPRPNSFVLDIPVNQGSSGSPLFMADGTVVGIVFAARINFSGLTILNGTPNPPESDEAGVFTPASLGLAIPSAKFPDSWLRHVKNRKSQTITDPGQSE